MLGGSLVSNTAKLSAEQDDTPIDPRLVGLGLSECERALLDCWPVVLRAEIYNALFALGIRGGGVNGFGAFDALQVADVVFEAAGRFDFCSEVGWARGSVEGVIIPIRDECGDMVDLAAWNVDTGMLALWRGAAAMLGAENIFAPRLGAPLLVHETTFDWLRAARTGIVILDPQRARWRLAEEQLVVDDVAFGRRLRDALRLPMPRVFVTMHERRAA
jgi:hypothetical protein